MEETEQTNVPENTDTPPTEPKEPTRFNLFMRKMLRWSTGVLAIFVLGIILTWVIQVSPKTKEIRELEDQLKLAKTHVEDLEYEVSSLQDLKEANTSLGVSLEETRLHLSILSILVDVSNAQFALINNSPEDAHSALAKTNAKLTSLSINLGSDHADAVSAMQERLALALDEISEDIFAAQSDLEVLRKNILGLERSIFG